MLMDTMFEKAIRLRYIKRGFNPVKEVDLPKIQKNEIEAYTEEELKTLREKIQIATNAKIKIKGTIYPGVCITISDVSLHIKQERSYTRYLKEKGEIVARPL